MNIKKPTRKENHDNELPFHVVIILLNDMLITVTHWLWLSLFNLPSFYNNPLSSSVLAGITVPSVMTFTSVLHWGICGWPIWTVSQMCDWCTGMIKLPSFYEEKAGTWYYHVCATVPPVTFELTNGFSWNMAWTSCHYRPHHLITFQFPTINSTNMEATWNFEVEITLAPFNIQS